MILLLKPPVQQTGQGILRPCGWKWNLFSRTLLRYVNYCKRYAVGQYELVFKRFAIGQQLILIAANLLQSYSIIFNSPKLCIRFFINRWKFAFVVKWSACTPSFYEDTFISQWRYLRWSSQIPSLAIADTFIGNHGLGLPFTCKRQGYLNTNGDFGCT